MIYTRNEWRELDPTPSELKKLATKCQFTGCSAEAEHCRTWQTAIMPAPAFNYYCGKHKPLVVDTPTPKDQKGTG